MPMLVPGLEKLKHPGLLRSLGLPSPPPSPSPIPVNAPYSLWSAASESEMQFLYRKSGLRTNTSGIVNSEHLQQANFKVLNVLHVVSVQMALGRKSQFLIPTLETGRSGVVFTVYPHEHQILCLEVITGVPGSNFQTCLEITTAI